MKPHDGKQDVEARNSEADKYNDALLVGLNFPESESALAGFDSNNGSQMSLSVDNHLTSYQFNSVNSWDAPDFQHDSLTCNQDVDVIEWSQQESPFESLANDDDGNLKISQFSESVSELEDNDTGNIMQNPIAKVTMEARKVLDLFLKRSLSQDDASPIKEQMAFFEAIQQMQEIGSGNRAAESGLAGAEQQRQDNAEKSENGPAIQSKTAMLNLCSASVGHRFSGVSDQQTIAQGQLGVNQLFSGLETPRNSKENQEGICCELVKGMLQPVGSDGSQWSQKLLKNEGSDGEVNRECEHRPLSLPWSCRVRRRSGLIGNLHLNIDHRSVPEQFSQESQANSIDSPSTPEPKSLSSSQSSGQHHVINRCPEWSQKGWEILQRRNAKRTKRLKKRPHPCSSSEEESDAGLLHKAGQRVRKHFRKLKSVGDSASHSTSKKKRKGSLLSEKANGDHRQCNRTPAGSRLFENLLYKLRKGLRSSKKKWRRSKSADASPSLQRENPLQIDCERHKFDVEQAKCRLVDQSDGIISLAGPLPCYETRQRLRGNRPGLDSLQLVPQETDGALCGGACSSSCNVCRERDDDDDVDLYDRIANEFAVMTNVPGVHSPEEIACLEHEIATMFRECGDRHANQVQLTSLIAQIAWSQKYSTFKEILLAEFGDETGWMQLATVFRLTHSALHMVGRGTRAAINLKEMTIQYFADKFADWVVKQGGWESVLEDSTENELD